MISSTKITTCVVFFIFLSLSMCGAITLPTSANFTKGKTVATNVKTIQPVSKIQCVVKCLEDGQKGRCSIAGYNRATKVCQQSLDRHQDVIDVNDEKGITQCPLTYCNYKQIEHVLEMYAQLISG